MALRIFGTTDDWVLSGRANRVLGLYTTDPATEATEYADVFWDEALTEPVDSIRTATGGWVARSADDVDAQVSLFVPDDAPVLYVGEKRDGTGVPIRVLRLEDRTDVGLTQAQVDARADGRITAAVSAGTVETPAGAAEKAAAAVAPVAADLVTLTPADIGAASAVDLAAETDARVAQSATTDAALADTQARLASSSAGLSLASRWADTYLDPPPAHDLPVVSFVMSSTSTIVSKTTHREARIGGVSNAALDWNGDPKFRYLGAPAAAAQPWGAAATQFIEMTTMPGGASQGRKYDLMIESETSAPEIEFRCHVANAGAGPIMFWVNGRWVASESLAMSTAAGEMLTKLAFPDARPRIIRALLPSGVRFGGAYATPSHPLKRTTYDIKRRVCVIADSIGTSTGAPPDGGRLVDTTQYHLPYLLGADETLAFGIGGTKWVASGAGDTAISHFGGDRLTAALALNPDALVFFGSRNDDGSSPAALAAITAAVEAALARCTDVSEVYVAGTVTDLPQNAAVRAGTLAAGRSFIDLNGIIYGTGKNGFPTGDGNADYFLRGAETPPVHPTLLGHRRIVRRFYEGIVGAFGQS